MRGRGFPRCHELRMRGRFEGALRSAMTEGRRALRGVPRHLPEVLKVPPHHDRLSSKYTFKLRLYRIHP